MNHKIHCSLLACFVAMSVLIMACGNFLPAADSLPTAVKSISSGKITTDGFNCPEPNPRMQVESKELNLYVWSTYVPQDFFECFQLVYGVKVNYDEYNSDEELDARLAGGTSYDLVQPTDFEVSLMLRQGFLQPLDHNKLPVLANFNPHYLNLLYDMGNQYTIPYQNGTDAIVVNTAKVKGVPRSWADLWNAEYAGRIVVADDERAIIGLTLLTLGYDVNTVDESQIKEAGRALEVLLPSIKSFDSDSPHSRLISGEVDLGETWTGEAFLAQMQVPSIQYIYPSEGPILWQDNWAMLKTALHPDAAYAWLNYTMQGDMFWMMLTNFPYTNPNDAALAYAKGNPMKVTDVNGKTTTLAAVYDAYINSPITNPPADVIKAGHRIDDVGSTTALYDQIWEKLKGGQ